MFNDFYVHIVESLTPNELLEGLTQGRALCSFLDLAGIPNLYNLVVDRKRFDVAMRERVDYGIRRFKVLPIVHLTAHGNEQGIQLTHQHDAGELILWKDLAELLKPLHQAILHYTATAGLGVCMSTCGGIHGRRMAEVMNFQDVPFAWLVGTATSVNIHDAALAFVVFYRGFQRGESQDQLIRAMQVASGVSDFAIEFGHLRQQEYSQANLQSFLENFLNI